MLPKDLLKLVLSFVAVRPDHVSKSLSYIARCFKKRCDEIEEICPSSTTLYSLELQIMNADDLIYTFPIRNWSIYAELQYDTDIFRRRLELHTSWRNLDKLSRTYTCVTEIDDVFFDLRNTAPREIKTLPDIFILPFMMRAKSSYHHQIVSEGEDLSRMQFDRPFTVNSMFRFVSPML
jgi:hypothetical protein